MNTTESKEYIEPTGFEGTKGEWHVLPALVGWVDVATTCENKTSMGSFNTSQKICNLLGTKEEIKANAILLSQSKNLAKALQCIITYAHQSDLIYTINDIDSEFGDQLTQLLGAAKEVLNKALNINQ